jgi:uncharacterized protein YukE
MRFETANIWQDFNTTSRTEYGTLDDNANEVILGPRLNEAVRHWANGYLKHLELGPEHKATDERAKLLDLHWGRIEQDGALLQGLGTAMTNFAKVLGDNVLALQERWQGDSYNAFKAAIDKVQATLSAYGNAATTTGQGLVEAMGQIRELYQTFADDSASKHLNFEDGHGHRYSPPEQWHKMTDHDDYSGFKLADVCPTTHSNKFDCLKNNDEQRNIITDHWVSQQRWEICENDPCEENPGRVVIMYRDMVEECDKAVGRIKGKLESYYGAVKTVVDGVSKLYDTALSNVDNLAKDQVFTTLRVVGGQPTGGGTPGGGDTSGYPVDGGSYPADTGGSPGDADPGPAAVAEPEPAPAEAPADTPSPDTPSPDTVAQAADQQEGVQIQDGDRTIGVTSPDGEGHVRVTVQDAAGTTKTYELDFDAASGRSAATPPASGEPGSDEAVPEQIAARTDGKCVIQDGELTITAERPLFSPDSIKLVVDDGTGNPATYTVDFDDQDAAAQQPDAATPQATPATAADADPAAGTTTEASPAAPNGSSVTTADQPAAPVTAPAEGAGATGPGTPQLTSPQAAWHDQAGSVSGVLDPGQHHSGEAEFAKAPDADQPEVGGAAGAGLPFLGAPPGGAGHEGARTGAGWSVHGDLFDNGEPVYSMHGVLGDDDGTAE